MIAFYPGSFDPVTRGHLDIIRRALAFCPHLAIGIGENNKKSTLFTAEERRVLLEAALAEVLSADEHSRVTIAAYTGPTIVQAQQLGASLIVKGLRTAADYAHEETMVMVNRRLDDTIDTVFLFSDNALRDVSSSIVKEMAMAGIAADKFDHYMTANARDALFRKLKK